MVSAAPRRRAQHLLACFCFLLFAADAAALEPVAPEFVCQRIGTQLGEVECLRAIEGLYVDRLAAAACDRIPTNSATVDCMRAIAGRRISQALTLACDALPTDLATVRCFQEGASGVSPGPGRYDQGNGTGYGNRSPGRERPRYYPPARPGGCNMYGCWRNGGGCNMYGCWNSPAGTCNMYGCSDYGGCNMYGCWNAPGGTCNMYGCSDYGACTTHGCPPR